MINNNFEVIKKSLNDIVDADWDTKYLNGQAEVKGKSIWGCCCRHTETRYSIAWKARVISDRLHELHQNTTYDEEQGSELKRLAANVSQSFENYKEAYKIGPDNSACINFKEINEAPYIKEFHGANMDDPDHAIHAQASSSIAVVLELLESSEKSKNDEVVSISTTEPMRLRSGKLVGRF